MAFLRVFLVCATACGMFNPGNRVASDFMSGPTLRGGRIIADAHPWFRSPRRTPRWAILGARVLIGSGYERKALKICRFCAFFLSVRPPVGCSILGIGLHLISCRARHEIRRSEEHTSELQSLRHLV